MHLNMNISLEEIRKALTKREFDRYIRLNNLEILTKFQFEGLQKLTNKFIWQVRVNRNKEYEKINVL